jgi:hypothetical protein
MDLMLLQQTAFNLLDTPTPTARKTAAKLKRTGTFTDNMSLPVHRWFRYSAGFSAEWVESIIKRHRFAEEDYIFDPFVGSGTTLLAAQKSGVCAAGAENHHFIQRIAKAKLSWNKNDKLLLDKALCLLKNAESRVKPFPATQSELLRRCYSEESLCKLEALKNAYLAEYSQDTEAELLWLAITAILRECSKAGTAQWQYILPNKSKSRVLDPFLSFIAKIKVFCSDIKVTQAETNGSAKVELAYCDARDLSSLSHLNGRVKLVITSPPYPNNYDYADATRLEMTFWDEVKEWRDLQESVRHRLVRSCSQHSAAEKLILSDLLSDPAIGPIRDELSIACRELEKIRETKSGKKTYHTMVAAYFVDLAKTWQSLSVLCAGDARVCFVVGDSAPYGIHIPVERWLGELALAAGFNSWAFEKIRDRNIKWKNRKHRVPLKEGNLWVEK